MMNESEGLTPNGTSENSSENGGAPNELELAIIKVNAKYNVRAHGEEARYLLRKQMDELQQYLETGPTDPRKINAFLWGWMRAVWKIDDHLGELLFDNREAIRDVRRMARDD